jgi:hypothetical protein
MLVDRNGDDKNLFTYEPLEVKIKVIKKLGDLFHPINNWERPSGVKWKTHIFG